MVPGRSLGQDKCHVRNAYPEIPASGLWGSPAIGPKKRLSWSSPCHAGRERAARGRRGIAAEPWPALRLDCASRLCFGRWWG
eukprot:3857318-Pyramimonas_sp.AAC.1